MHKYRATESDLTHAKYAHVLGNPVKHSLSPALHNAAYQYFELPYSYSALETDVDGCNAVIAKLSQGEIFGLSLTMPFKEIGYEAADDVTDVSKLTEVVNTLVYRSGKIVGENTDVYGITQCLQQELAENTKPWAVLGSGATARSAIVALQQLGITNVCVIARDNIKLQALHETYQVETFHHDFPKGPINLISTIPGSAQPQLASIMQNVDFLFDVNYANWPTHFGEIANLKNIAHLNGYSMLVHQAVLQIEIMLGRHIDPAILFNAIT